MLERTIIQYLSVKPRSWTMRTIVIRIAHVQYDLQNVDVLPIKDKCAYTYEAFR